MSRCTLRSSFALLTLLLLAAASGDVQLDYFRVEKEEAAFVVRWEAINEAGVRQYELFRKTSLSGDRFVKIHTRSTHGASRPYEFRDTQVFKDASETVTYSLEAVLSGGERKTFERISEEYTSTALRRTWGSIKAMFQ